MHYLACKGEWVRSTLILRAEKSNIREDDKLYTFLTKKQLVEEYGEELAEDLISRHVESESKLPKSKQGRFIKKTLGCRQVALAIYHLIFYFTKWP